MNADTGRFRKLVPVLCQGQMIVALNQTLESRFGKWGKSPGTQVQHELV